MRVGDDYIRDGKFRDLAQFLQRCSSMRRRRACIDRDDSIAGQDKCKVAEIEALCDQHIRRKLEEPSLTEAESVQNGERVIGRDCRQRGIQ